MSTHDELQRLRATVRGFIADLSNIGGDTKDFERLARIVHGLEIISIDPTPSEADFVKRRAQQLAAEYESLMPTIEESLRTRLEALQ